MAQIGEKGGAVREFDEEESEAWDRLVVEIAEIEAKGGIAVSGGEPYWRDDD